MLRVETFIGNVLRYGVLLCALVIGVGLSLTFLTPEKLDPPLAQFLPALLNGQVFAAGMPSLVGSNPNAIIAIGLLMLIALPVLRVFLTLLIFLVERDRAYIVITTVVLLVLIFGLALGKAV